MQRYFLLSYGYLAALMREGPFYVSVMQIVVFLVTPYVHLPTSVAYLACLSPPNLASPPALSSTVIALRKTLAILLELCYKVRSVAQGSGLDHVLLLCF